MSDAASSSLASSAETATNHAWRHRLPTTSRPLRHAPPLAVLRAPNAAHTLFFDFRLLPHLAPADVLRIFTDPALAHSEDVLGIAFIAQHRLARIVFRYHEAVAYHLAEARQGDTEVACWQAVPHDAIALTVWLNNVPIAEPVLVQAWIRDAFEAALNVDPHDVDGWRVHDVRLQFFDGTAVMTDTAAVSLLLPASAHDSADELQRLLYQVPRELEVGGVLGVTVAWHNAPPYCRRCCVVGQHTTPQCRATPSEASLDLGARRRTRRGRRGRSDARSPSVAHPSNAPSSLQLPDVASTLTFERLASHDDVTVASTSSTNLLDPTMLGAELHQRRAVSPLSVNGRSRSQQRLAAIAAGAGVQPVNTILAVSVAGDDDDDVPPAPRAVQTAFTPPSPPSFAMHEDTVPASAGHVPRKSLSEMNPVQGFKRWFAATVRPSVASEDAQPESPAAPLPPPPPLEAFEKPLARLEHSRTSSMAATAHTTTRLFDDDLAYAIPPELSNSTTLTATTTPGTDITDANKLASQDHSHISLHQVEHSDARFPATEDAPTLPHSDAFATSMDVREIEKNNNHTPTLSTLEA